MTTHLAAVSPAKGQRFELRSRPTPKPGPGELLIAVKSVAINPADGLMRDQGLFIPDYPTVIGFDIAGLVLEVGDNVPTAIGGTDGDPGLSFRPGVTRVAAYAASFWKSCDPDYGAFQERCLVPWQHAVPLPDEETMSWNRAATLPVAVEVLLSAWDALGILRVGMGDDASAPASALNPVSASASTGTGISDDFTEKNQKREALLIWGASSSVGTMGVQGARLVREDRQSSFAAVYATAGPANEEYVRSLGADRVFDYKDPRVVGALVSAAREDGLVIRRCFLATGELAPCQAVLEAFLGDDDNDDDGSGEKNKIVKIASAPIVPADADAVDGVETVFLHPSMDEGTRLEQFRYWMGTWLRNNLENRVIRPSPEPMVVGKGLGYINTGLDMVLQGVSCTKLVIEVEE
ncbi:GroES-like protein [Hypoxylon rubiginosum]|uniref:GroES-like protein n=1 Tax=Hypoxylon rubiginosum TaxID=110542 RepID=A0ACB9YUG1_9PEZI|nr:GroES-like protein [Hypoxylon rubiginosum]